MGGRGKHTLLLGKQKIFSVCNQGDIYMNSKAIEFTTNKGSNELSPALQHLLELHLPQRFPGSYSQEKVSQQETGRNTMTLLGQSSDLP